MCELSVITHHDKHHADDMYHHTSVIIKLTICNNHGRHDRNQVNDHHAYNDHHCFYVECQPERGVHRHKSQLPLREAFLTRAQPGGVEMVKVMMITMI